MRRAAVVVALVLAVAGCKREPSFDDRYNATANEIELRAARIDDQLNTAGAATTAPAQVQR